MTADLALIVPVYKNFPGFAEMIRSVDYPVQPFIGDNWEFNRGVARVWNAGLQFCIAKKIPYALITNDDLLFDEETIYKLRKDMDERVFTSALNTRDFTLTTTEQHEEHPDFACFMVNVEEFVGTVGYFDEHFYPAYFEDNDMHYRMKQAGLPAVRRQDAGIYHEGSVTQNWEGEMVVSHENFRKNRLYYSTKWGGVPGEETYTVPFGTGQYTIKDW